MDILRRDGKRLSENVRLWSSTRVSLLSNILRVKGCLSVDPSKDVLDTIQDMNIASSVLAWLNWVVFHLAFQLALSLVVLCSQECDYIDKSRLAATVFSNRHNHHRSPDSNLSPRIFTRLQHLPHRRLSKMHAIPMSSDNSESENQELAPSLQSSPSNTASVPSKQNGYSLTTSSSALLDGLELSLFVISISFIYPLLLIFNTCLYLKRLPFAPLFSLVYTILYFLFVTIKTVFKILGIVSKILICLLQILRRILPFLITTFLAYVSASAFVFVRDSMDDLRTFHIKYGRMC